MANVVKDDDALKQFVGDSLRAMRWRSETEYRLLGLLAVLCPAMITAMFGIAKLGGDRLLDVAFPISLAFFLIFLTISFSVKILAEHKVYEALGQQVVKAWEYFGLFEAGTYGNNAILTADAKKLGTGQGHCKTLLILWAMTIGTVAILVVAAFILHIAD